MQQLLSGKLRGYQNLIVKSITERFVKNDNTALIVASTGAGKTVCFIALVQQILAEKSDLRVLFMVNRVQLLKQLEGLLRSYGFDVGVVSGSMSRREFDSQFTIASYLSIINIPPSHYNLIIWDEVHRFAPQLDDSSTPLARWYSQLKELNPLVRDVGFTATPYTSSRRIYGDGKHFKEIACEVGMKQLLAEGYLAKVKSFVGAQDARFNMKGVKTQNGDWALSDLTRLAEDDNKRTKQVADALKHLNNHDRKCVVWQCIGIEHCESVTRELLELGETVALIHSKQDEFEQTTELDEFMRGERRHLVFVSIVSEGFDHAPIDAVVLLRPTKSPVLYVQSVGRALRPHPGKLYSLLIDYGHVIKNCGPVDYPFVRQMEDIEAKDFSHNTKIENLQEQVVECFSCGHMNFLELTPTSKCNECGVSLYEQRQNERVSKLSKEADKYSKLYSDVEIKRVLDMRCKWNLFANGAQKVVFTYVVDGGEVEETLTVDEMGLGSGLLHKARLGQISKLKARMGKIGCIGETLHEMALSQNFLYMPLAIVTDMQKVYAICDWQLIVWHDEPSEAIQERLL
jgi:superfamily II DNA or RNA helicase